MEPWSLFPCLEGECLDRACANTGAAVHTGASVDLDLPIDEGEGLDGARSNTSSASDAGVLINIYSHLIAS
jgi:hypothetical protein